MNEETINLFHQVVNATIIVVSNPREKVVNGFFQGIFGTALSEGSGEASDVVGTGVGKCGEVLVAGAVEGVVDRVGDNADDAEVCAVFMLEFAEGVGTDLRFGSLRGDTGDGGASALRAVKRVNAGVYIVVDEVGSVLIGEVGVVGDAQRDAFDGDVPAFSLEKSVH